MMSSLVTIINHVSSCKLCGFSFKAEYTAAGSETSSTVWWDAVALLIPPSTLSSWELYLYNKCWAERNASKRWNRRWHSLWVNSCIILTESITTMERRYSGPLKHNQQSKHGCKTESDTFTSVMGTFVRAVSMMWILMTVKYSGHMFKKHTCQIWAIVGFPAETKSTTQSGDQKVAP